MIGAGVFVAFAPAAAAAGSLLFVALGLAACVAYCNATSTARLAAVHPASGGTYVYGRERLGPWWGFAAGWSFCIGKTASCAAMALTVAAYAVPTEFWAQVLPRVREFYALERLCRDAPVIDLQLDLGAPGDQAAAQHAVELVVARGQEHHRHVREAGMLADLQGQRGAADAGHVQVGDHRVVVAHRQRVEHFLAAVDATMTVVVVPVQIS